MATPSEPAVRFHAYLPHGVYETLKQLSKEEDRSMSSVLRLALEDRAKRAAEAKA